MSQTVTRSGSPAVRQGLIFGVIIGVIQIIIALIGLIASLGTLGLIFSLLSIIVALVCYLLAGIRSSQQTGKVSTGLLAGLIAGLIGSIISFVETLIYTFINANSLAATAQRVANQNHVNFHYTAGLIISGIAIYGVGLIILAVVVGLAVGSIGGAIGKRQARIPEQSYQEAMFQAPPPPQTPYGQ